MASLVTHRLIAPLASANFRVLWIGQSISALGDPLQAIALVWLVLARTGAPSALATAMIALTVPRVLFTLVGGVATDQFSPRLVMLGSDLVRAGAIGVLAALAAADRLDMRLLYALLAITGIAGGIFVPAATSITPHIVEPDRLQAANALMLMTPQAAMVLGAPLAGLLVAMSGPESALALNALSFVIAAFSAWLLDDLCPASRQNARTSFWRKVPIGVAAVWRIPWLRAIVGVDAVLTLAVSGPLSVGLPVLVREIYGGPGTYSVMLAAFGMGSMLGMGFLGARAPARHRGWRFCLLQLAQAPLIATLVFGWPSLATGALLGVGVLHGFSGVVYLTLIQDDVDADIRGRVMSVVALVPCGLIPVSQAMTGAASDAGLITPLFVVAASILVVGAGAGLLMPALRQVD